MRRFILRRHEDETGLSGNGHVAWGVLFPDGTAVTRWCVTDVRQTCVWRSMADVHVVHGHGGKTEVVYLDSDSRGELIAKPALLPGCEGLDAELVAMENNCAPAEEGARAAYEQIDEIRAPAGWIATAGWWQGGRVCLRVHSPAKFLRAEVDEKTVRRHYERDEVYFEVSREGVRSVDQGGIRMPDAPTITVDGVAATANRITYWTVGA